jgi:Fe-S-cluster containining protein
MTTAIARFGCTLCGACCNRSPEVALSEAAALADVFVFRLMFRLYWLARAPGPNDDKAAFYERKRLLGAFAAHKAPAKIQRLSPAADGTRYLMISALALDTSEGACAALEAGRCTIHARRPLACRSVPFHYSRPEALAARDLAAFVATPGYRCDTSEGAELVLQGGRIVDAPMRQARQGAVALAGEERRWQAAIVRRIGAKSSGTALPRLADIEANAAFGATTTSMRVAWQIAAEVGLIGRDESEALAAAQLATIDRAFARCEPKQRESFAEMRADYRRYLGY